MKILLVIDSLGSGGAQRLYANLAKTLCRNGHQVEIFIYVADNQFYGEEFTNAGIKIHVAKRMGKGFSWQVVRQLRRIIKNGYDGIISTLHAPGIYSAIAKLGIKQGCLIVCEVSSSAAPVPKLKKFLFYISNLLANAVVTNSYSEAEIMKRKPFISGKISTIWNGYDLEPHSVEYNFHNANICSLLVVGRIAYPKNGVNLLKALAIFLARKLEDWFPDFHPDQAGYDLFPEEEDKKGG